MTSMQRIFLRLEQSDYPMDTLGIFVLEPGPDGPLDFDTVRAFIDQRIREIPELMRQQSQTVRGIAEERWMQAPTFDIHHHLARLSVPPPGDLKSLRDLAVALSRTPLDRRRPLWRAWYVEGGTEGTTALLIRIHHALLEGLGGMSVDHGLFTLAPTPVDRSVLPPPVTGDPYPTEAAMLRRGVTGLAEMGFTASRRLLTLAKQRVTARTDPGSSSAGHSHGPPPRTLFDRAHRTPAKSLGVASLPRSEIAEIIGANPILTTNDIVLAAITGGVRAYLDKYDTVPDRPLRTACPMFAPTSVDDAEGDAEPFTVVLMHLPVDVADRQERLIRIHRRNARRIRAFAQARPGNRAILGVGDASHPMLVATTSSLLATGAASLLPPMLNLTVGIFRISDQPLYFAEAKIRHVYGRTPVLPPQRVFVHAAVYDEWVDLGVSGLRDVLREPGALVSMMRAELTAILDLARAGRLTRP